MEPITVRGAEVARRLPAGRAGLRPALREHPSASGVSPFFGRQDCEMTRWRSRGLVFKVRRVWGGFGNCSVSCLLSMT